MMPACVHAARDVEIELADVVQIIEIVEAALDRLGNRYRFGVRERAEVAAGAADDVRQQADVRRCDSEHLELVPQCEQIGLANVGKDQVLLVRNAKLAETVVVRESRN